MLLALLQTGLASLPWDSWSWASPQAPIEYFFRKQQDVLVKSPDLKCRCPPHKECVLEYKINEDMAEFQKIQGILKEEEVKELKKFVQESQKDERDLQKENIRRRRQNEDVDQECCCPSRSVMMPTFITEKKFDEIAERLQKKILSE